MGNGVGRSGGYLAGVRAGLPFAVVVGVVGFSFGALARSLGWGVIAPIAFSVATFSVTAQFAVAAVLGAGGGAITAIAAAVLVALVVTGTFGEGGHLTIDEKALGVGVAAVALALRTPILLAVVLAALVTALARLFLG